MASPAPAAPPLQRCYPRGHSSAGRWCLRHHPLGVVRSGGGWQLRPDYPPPSWRAGEEESQHWLEQASVWLYRTGIDLALLDTRRAALGLLTDTLQRFPPPWDQRPGGDVFSRCAP